MNEVVVLAARRAYREGEANVPELARSVGVTSGAMYCALAGTEAWAHVPEPLGWGFAGRKRRKPGGRVKF